jgi:hypothetical protein
LWALHAESVHGRDKVLCLAWFVESLPLSLTLSLTLSSQEEVEVKLNFHLSFTRSITGEYLSPLLYLPTDIVG